MSKAPVWEESPKGTWNLGGFRIVEEAVEGCVPKSRVTHFLYRVYRPGAQRRCASFVLLRRAKLAVEKALEAKQRRSMEKKVDT